MSTERRGSRVGADGVGRCAMIAAVLSVIAVHAPEAQQGSATSRAPSGAVAIRGGTVLTMNGPALRGATVLLRNGKIAAVGANITIPTDATVVDASGKFVMPGLIDA